MVGRIPIISSELEQTGGKAAGDAVGGDAVVPPDLPNHVFWPSWPPAKNWNLFSCMRFRSTGRCGPDRQLLPGATYAPTLYSLGDSVKAWAAAVLNLVGGDRLLVVGCSVGGSCAIELAVAAPDRVAALVLIGTRAAHRPDPALHASVPHTLREKGVEEAWKIYWAPLFSRSAAAK